MEKFNFNAKFSGLIVLVFILFTIVGTLTHEVGHILIAKFLGYETELYYGSMNYFHKGYNEDNDVKEYFKLAKANNNQIVKDLPFPEKERFKALELTLNAKYPINNKHAFLITLGGPLQTLITCFLGLCILWYRKSTNKKEFKTLDWLGVFLTLFILREVFNTIMALCSFVVFKTNKFYGDEFDISRALEMNQWVVPIITAIIGILISGVIVFKVIPQKYRLSFIISGCIGSLLGFTLWFYFLGPMLIP